MNCKLIITIENVSEHGGPIWTFSTFLMCMPVQCAMVISYISKAQKGMSELLRKAVEEAKEGNTNIKQQV